MKKLIVLGLLVLASVSYAADLNEPPASFTFSSATITQLTNESATASLLVSANEKRRGGILLNWTATNDFYIRFSASTTSYPLTNWGIKIKFDMVDANWGPSNKFFSVKDFGLGNMFIRSVSNPTGDTVKVLEGNNGL